MRIRAGVDFGRVNDYTSMCGIRYDVRPLQLVKFARFKPKDWKQGVEVVGKLIDGCDRTFVDGSGVGDGLYGQLFNATSIVLIGNSRTDPYEPKMLLKKLDLEGRRFSCPSRAISEVLRQGIKNLVVPEGVEAPKLKEELENFIRTSTRGGRDHFAAKKGHDDTVFALALALLAVLIGDRINAPN